MEASPSFSAPASPLERPGRLRRAFHLLVAAAGWLLFGYWWWLVLGRTGSEEVASTILFVAISLVVVVVVTVLWVAHNLGVARRRRGRRILAQAAEPGLREDALGRPVRVGREARDVRAAPVVFVAIEGGSKVYATGSAPAGVRARLAVLAADGTPAGDLT